jgi:uncharacterized oligopeptide transporter (OPT) family protein
MTWSVRIIYPPPFMIPFTIGGKKKINLKKKVKEKVERKKKRENRTF